MSQGSLFFTECMSHNLPDPTQALPVEEGSPPRSDASLAILAGCAGGRLPPCTAGFADGDTGWGLEVPA